MLTRRHFIRTTTALFSAAAANPLIASTWPDATQKAAWDAEVEAGGPNPWYASALPAAADRRE